MFFNSFPLSARPEAGWWVCRKKGGITIKPSYTIYLAGGISGISRSRNDVWRKLLKIQLSGYDSDIQIINPYEFYSRWDNPKAGSEQEIRAYYLYRLRHSDLVIVNLNLLDPIGGAQELAIAAEHRIPVIGLMEKIEKNHPWLTLCCSKIFRNLDLLAEYVHYYYLT